MNDKTSKPAPLVERKLVELVRAPCAAEQSITERGQAEEAAQRTQNRSRDLIAPVSMSDDQQSVAIASQIYRDPLF
jgi:hypothetical protein